MTGLHALTEWLSVHQDWVALAIGLIAFAESLAIVGLLLPGVVMLFATASLAGTGVLDVWTMLMAGFIGAVLGDGISFWLGQAFHDRIPGIWPFRNHPQWLSQGQVFFEKHGGVSIAIGRFVGPVRPVIPMVAGMMGMPKRYFLVINILSSIVWAPVYLLPGYFVGASLHWKDHLPVEWLLATGLLLTLAVAISWLVTVLLKHALQQKPQQKLYLWSLGVFLSLMAVITVVIPFAASLNNQVAAHASSLQTPLLTTIFANITRIGDLMPMVLLTVMTTLWLTHDLFKTKEGWILKDLNAYISVGLFMGLALGLEAVIYAIKDFYILPRPSLATSTTFAYPSGHATYSMFIGLWLGWYFGRMVPERFRNLVWSASLFMALLVAESRIYLSEHWLTDVLGGAALGASVFVMWLLVEQRFPVPVRQDNIYWRLLQLIILYSVMVFTIW